MCGYTGVWVYWCVGVRGVYIRDAPMAPKVPDAAERSGAASLYIYIYIGVLHYVQNHYP